MYLQKLLVVCFFIAGFKTLKAQTADEIVARYIAFTGGEQHWKKVQSIVTSGIYNYGGIQFPFTAYSKRPNLYKFIVPFKGKYFAQGFDGTKGWKIDAFKGETKKTLLSGKPARALANEADVELESPFIKYKTKGYQLTLTGKDTANGTMCYAIELLRKNGEKETYYFNEKDFSMVKKIAVAKNTELENALLETTFDNYKMVKGLRIPYSAVSKVNDQVILTITISKTQVNVP